MKHTPQDREKLLREWLASITGYDLIDVRPASADASFRQYFRVTDAVSGNTYIVMDAPPEKENCEAFIHIAALLRGVTVNAPELLREDQTLGFLLLSDLGDQPYLDHLTENHADTLYADAISALVRMQKIHNGLPDYNEQRLREEMELFENWYLGRHLGISLKPGQKQDLDAILKLLVDNALAQPQVFVHRDYHSRNLMLVQHDNPGVIDFQDAVIGPVTYDLVSLFKDCYIEWPRQKVEHWLQDYLMKSGLDAEWQTFIRWFDLMGVQRHLKVLGIFSRLNYRDGKAQYLNDLPLTLKYVIDSCRQYDDLLPLLNIMEQHVLPHPGVQTA